MPEDGPARFGFRGAPAAENLHGMPADAKHFFRRPAGLMAGYAGDGARTSDVVRNGFYHTGDVAAKDEDFPDLKS